MKKVFVTIVVALFATVVFGQIKTEIKPAELPGCLNDWLKVNMKGYYFEKAYKIDNHGVFSYIAKAALSKVEPAPKDAAKPKTNQDASKLAFQWLATDADCKGVKKIQDPKPEPGPTPGPKPKPAPAPQPEPTPKPK